MRPVIMKKRKKKRTHAVRILDRQQLRKQQGLWLVRVSFFFLLSFIVFWCWIKLHDPSWFPIQVITIEGECQHIDKKAIRQAILPFTKNNFFTINMGDLRERLLRFPWLNTVLISKEWPNRLHIQLQEQKPIASWCQHNLINSEGKFFGDPKEISLSLPDLCGPTGEQHNVWQTYILLNEEFSYVNLKIKSLELTHQETWNIELDNGIKLILGQKDLKKRLDRFVRSYPGLTQQGAIEYIDLRYAHGMAVKYKKGTKYYGKEKVG
ncbi:MAG: hypothetical protein A3G71_03395 [Gammaproteobacteria bacterium RIFCSPLOWO2_12_FULL_38_14]|nr:MAG: hypothetical protein A3G71_03395 [Gammaproteobacteria bacterium RIFCSPLOWO2_12_FULL_38_14]